MPSYTETIDFSSCYSHWKLNPKPSVRKSCKKNYSHDAGEDDCPVSQPLPKFLQGLNPKVCPKIELKVPKFKKTLKKKKKMNVVAAAEDIRLFSQQLIEQGRNHAAFAESQPGMGMQISFTEVVINSMEDFKKLPKDSVMKKSSIWNPIGSPSPAMPTMMTPVPSCDYMNSSQQQSSMILQQILSEEKRFDDAVEQQTRAVLESIHENQLARLQEMQQKTHQAQQAPQSQPHRQAHHHAQPVRLLPGTVAFPLSRIPSLEKLQFNMQPSTTAGHNFSGFPAYFGPNISEYPSFKGQYIAERTNMNTTHVPLSTGRTASFEKILSYWQDCSEPAVVPVQIPVELLLKAEPCPLDLEDIPDPLLVQPPSFEDFLSDDSNLDGSSPLYSPFEDECHSPADLHFVDQVLSV